MIVYEASIPRFLVFLLALLLLKCSFSQAQDISVHGNQVVLDNGVLQVTLSNPGGLITGVRFNGIDNLLEFRNRGSNRGYWNLDWSEPGMKGYIFDTVEDTDFKIIRQDADVAEVSFISRWSPSLKGRAVPLNIDKRFVMLRGSSGFYTYAIFEHLEGWPDFDIIETRLAFKLRQDKFHYMAMADNRQRIMPIPQDRMPPRGVRLDYPEAVRMVDPVNEDLKGEVDDKYQYSLENEDIKVHGWVCLDPPVGFWQITPTNEFRTGGPLKQDLTSHVGPTSLTMFVSSHYAGRDLNPKFRNGEPWKKVFGPVFIYLNSNPGKADPAGLWEDAKSQVEIQTQRWPYSFIASEDFPKADQRGSVNGRFLVRDRYHHKGDTPAASAYVGLALPGEAGSWQWESKGYQFWTTTGINGSFSINNVRPGDYNLYAWVPGFIGDYMYASTISISAKRHIDLGDLVYQPPRDGPTLWEIGIPDRTAAEFYIPDPNPLYVNKLYMNHNRFRQYGLWERYGELYPTEDLVYTVGVSDYRNDWFFAHVTRSSSGTYLPTTWQIRFTLEQVVQGGIYKLRIALASAKSANLQVRINNPNGPRCFSSGRIGDDNSIARHGIHGLYWLYTIDLQGSWLSKGDNSIFLTQARAEFHFNGIMYDYIRLEGPSSDGHGTPASKRTPSYPDSSETAKKVRLRSLT